MLWPRLHRLRVSLALDRNDQISITRTFWLAFIGWNSQARKPLVVEKALIQQDATHKSW